MVFNNFSGSNSANIMQMLRVLRELATETRIIHTTVIGGRGVDYKTNEPALVIIAKDPSNLSEYRQFAGRGCREVEKKADVEVIVKHDSLLANASCDSVETVLASLETERVNQDIFKMKCAAVLDGQTILSNAKNRIKQTVEWFNDASVAILPEKESADFEAVKLRYYEIRAVWKVLPAKWTEIQFADLAAK